MYPNFALSVTSLGCLCKVSLTSESFLGMDVTTSLRASSVSTPACPSMFLTDFLESAFFTENVSFMYALGVTDLISSSNSPA